MFPPKVLIDSVFLGLGKWYSTGTMAFVSCSQYIAGFEEHGRVPAVSSCSQLDIFPVGIELPTWTPSGDESTCG
jgi:hypothetical protein